MASIRAILGLFPKTADIEAKRASLEKEFEALNEYANSPELAEYNELNTLIPGSAFIARKKEIKAQKFQNTEEYRKEKEFHFLKKRR
ncbi:MAG: hypothetical protein HC906_19490 [Bacteroidales bacterium]|nr:hypothetical protein [Bacteroidales bacterium]